MTYAIEHMTDKLCPVCGLKFTETSRGITVDGKPYHDKCITELSCDNCGVVMGYLARDATIEGRNPKMFCAACSKKVMAK
jgi:C4-type Zn-finger protein